MTTPAVFTWREVFGLPRGVVVEREGVVYCAGVIVRHRIVPRAAHHAIDAERVVEAVLAKPVAEYPPWSVYGYNWQYSLPARVEVSA